MKTRTLLTLLLALSAPALAEPRACILQLTGLEGVTSQKVLVIGDSHSYGPIGDRLMELLGEVPRVQYEFYGAWGSAPWHWNAGTKAAKPLIAHDQSGKALRVPDGDAVPKMSDLLARLKPGLVVLEQGGNLMPIYPRDPARVSARELEQMDGEASCAIPAIEKCEGSSRRLMRLVRSSGARCVWLAPPRSRRMISSCFAERYAKMREWAEAEGCAFVDSRAQAEYPAQGGDGVHFERALGDEVVAMAHAVAEHAFESAVCPELSALLTGSR